jgi:hypothetical protein
MGVSFFPAQKVSIGGTEVSNVQSASLEFSNPKRAVYRFGQFTPIGSVRSELGTATFTVTWAVGAGSRGGTVAKVSSLSQTLTDTTVGTTVTMTAGGTFSMAKAFLSSFSAKGSVGDIATCTATFTSTDATFAAAASANPTISAVAKTDTVYPFDQIQCNLAGATNCRSFNFSLDIPRQNVVRLGSLTPVANIPTASPTAKLSAEIILGAGGFTVNKDGKYSGTINVGGYVISVAQFRMGNFQTNAIIDGVSTANVSLEQELESLNNVKF